MTSTSSAWVATSLAMIAFAANSLLCRAALGSSATDPASFTMIRIVSGALALVAISRLRGEGGAYRSGNLVSSIALFAYAAAFSFAYVTLATGTGALLLFGAVQATMIGYGVLRGERLGMLQMTGMLLAGFGLVGLLLPGATAPPVVGSVLMIGAGVAWGVYSLRGRGSVRPLQDTAGNFVRAMPFALLLWLVFRPEWSIEMRGMLAAIASGALASGIGYAIWYTALRSLRATTAATVQLSVPVIAAAAGVVLLGESVGPRLVVASVAILGGIGLVLGRRRR